MNEASNLPKLLLQLTGTFEFELLIELMLRYWNHPMAADDEFRNHLLESACLILHEAAEGSSPIENMSAKNVNLVAAVCHAEANFVLDEHDHDLKVQRESWLRAIYRALPSCFCD